jgi:hypothetical protein
VYQRTLIGSTAGLPYIASILRLVLEKGTAEATHRTIIADESIHFLDIAQVIGKYLNILLSANPLRKRLIILAGLDAPFRLVIQFRARKLSKSLVGTQSKLRCSLISRRTTSKQLGDGLLYNHKVRRVTLRPQVSKWNFKLVIVIW